jgi:hypothetical protein
MLYPSPAATTSITVLGKYGAFDYQVLNNLGQVVTQGSSSNNRIEISNLVIGLYNVRIKFSDGNVALEKFVKS